VLLSNSSNLLDARDIRKALEFILLLEKKASPVPELVSTPATGGGENQNLKMNKGFIKIFAWCFDFLLRAPFAAGSSPVKSGC